MQGTYDTALVLLSVLIAALASYVSIEFAGRVDCCAGRRRGWLLAGAVAMGSGIWSMHFVGMTAFELPVAISFDLSLTVLSWVAAVAVSAIALVLVTGSLLLDTNDADALLAWSRAELLPLLAPLSSAGLRFEFGLAIAPADGSNSQMLLLRAGARSASLEWLIEHAIEADGLTAAA